MSRRFLENAARFRLRTIETAKVANNCNLCSYLSRTYYNYSIKEVFLESLGYFIPPSSVNCIILVLKRTYGTVELHTISITHQRPKMSQLLSYFKGLLLARNQHRKGGGSGFTPTALQSLTAMMKSTRRRTLLAGKLHRQILYNRKSSSNAHQI